mmetsp:Transcript_36252/g.100053  ORF Transcript_36252/g.100053 Transcript_36252/m.100053 type:complete len:377 (+) Transcript_36252:1063-2193(+)
MRSTMSHPCQRLLGRYPKYRGARRRKMGEALLDISVSRRMTDVVRIVTSSEVPWMRVHSSRDVRSSSSCCRKHSGSASKITSAALSRPSSMICAVRVLYFDLLYLTLFGSSPSFVVKNRYAARMRPRPRKLRSTSFVSRRAPPVTITRAWMVCETPMMTTLPQPKAVRSPPCVIRVPARMPSVMVSANVNTSSTMTIAISICLAYAVELSAMEWERRCILFESWRREPLPDSFRSVAFVSDDFRMKSQVTLVPESSAKHEQPPEVFRCDCSPEPDCCTVAASCCTCKSSYSGMSSQSARESIEPSSMLALRPAAVGGAISDSRLLRRRSLGCSAAPEGRLKLKKLALPLEAEQVLPLPLVLPSTGTSRLSFRRAAS